MLAELFASIRRELARLWTPRPLTPRDIRTAYVVAVAIDVAQLLLGPFGWVGADEVLDAG